MSDLQIIDPEAIENLRALNPGDGDEFLREIVAIYLEDTPQRIAELDQSLASGDVAQFTRAAHSVKGSSANLGAITVRGVAEQLEQRSHKEGLGNVAELVNALKTQFSAAQVEFTKYLRPA